MADGLFGGGGAYFGNPNIARQGARARELAQERNAETLPDPRTYGFVQGLLGTNPDELGMSVLSPNTAPAKEAAYYGAQLSNALGIAPVLSPAVKGAGRLAGEAINEAMVYGTGPLAKITPQPMRMVTGKTAQGMAPVVKQAEQLAAQGYPEYKITELTGLEKVPTPSGFEWGKQISDVGAALNKDAFDNLRFMKDTPLSAVLNHPELFKAYPDLKDLKVQELSMLFRGMNTAGLYDPKNDLIELSKHISFGDNKYKDSLSTLLHEVQHAIQKREGWPGGTNPAQFTPASSKKIKTALSSIEDDLAKKASAISGNNVSKYTLGNALNYLEGNTLSVSKQEAALIEALKGNKELGEVVKRFQSFDGIRGRLRQRDVKAEQLYNRAASEVQARATQKQFEQGKMTVPLTKTEEYTTLQNPLLWTDPMGYTIK
jgi:hypothetical protein